MEAWDYPAADAAVSALCRGSGAAETMEPLWRMAVRDQRNIGHKAIFAAQSWRTLQTIGWEHAEPVVRSLVFGMLDLQGDSRPRPVGPYEANLENAGKVRQDWQIGAMMPARPGRSCKSSARRRPKRHPPRPSSCSIRAPHRARSGTQPCLRRAN